MKAHFIFWPLAITVSTLLLGGCGDDNNPTIEIPSAPESNIRRPHPNLEIVGNHAETELDGKIGVRIGQDAPFILDMKQITLPTTRPDIFAEGQHSVFDLLRYLAQEGHLELEWDGTINRFDTVDFKVNGSDDWFYKSFHSSFRLENADSRQMKMFEQDIEWTYERIDLALIKNGVILQFLPAPNIKAIATSAHQAESERSNKLKDGEVVVPNVYVHTKTNYLNYKYGVDLERPAYHLKDVQVTAHDLREDLWQPGTVTMLDLFASIATNEEYSSQFGAGQEKIQMVYWPKLNIGREHDDQSEVESFAITQIAGKHEDSVAGWALFTGEAINRYDFGYGQGTVCPDGMDPDYPTQPCQYFGGNLTHILTDNRVMRTAPEEVHLYYWDVWGNLDNPNTAFDQEGNRIKKKWPGKSDHYQFYSDPTNPIPEGIANIKNIEDAMAPLQRTHFGWGVADCGQCHSVEGIHAKNDSGERFEHVKAYECAECHGANGAPQGHDQTGRCFWCHQQVTGHRDMSTNNDYYEGTAEIFPDPYSCLTCHQNPLDGITDRSIDLSDDIRYSN